MKTKRKIFCGGIVIIALTYAISIIPNFRHRAEWNRTVAALRGTPRERVNSAIQIFAAAQKAQGRRVPETVSLRELVANGFLRDKEASPFPNQDIQFAVLVDETNPDQIIVRVPLSSGLALVELADGSIQEATR